MRAIELHIAVDVNLPEKCSIARAIIYFENLEFNI